MALNHSSQLDEAPTRKVTYSLQMIIPELSDHLPQIDTYSFDAPADMREGEIDRRIRERVEWLEKAYNSPVHVRSVYIEDPGICFFSQMMSNYTEGEK